MRIGIGRGKKILLSFMGVSAHIIFSMLLVTLGMILEFYKIIAVKTILQIILWAGLGFVVIFGVWILYFAFVNISTNNSEKK